MGRPAWAGGSGLLPEPWKVPGDGSDLPSLFLTDTQHTLAAQDPATAHVGPRLPLRHSRPALGHLPMETSASSCRDGPVVSLGDLGKIDNQVLPSR